MSQGALPGFRDFYPEQLATRNYLMGVWRDVARRYGFVEYDGPPLEPLELYTKKSGDEIVGQLYAFTDKGDREVALRPEMTPTLARMVAAKANAMRKPIRWFSMPQLFRYERQQKGRLREHFQWNVDIVGEPGVSADAELLAVAIDAMRSFGLGPQDVVARVSDRRILQGFLTEIGVPESSLGSVYGVMDKLGREDQHRSEERLADAQVPPAARTRILDLQHAGIEDVSASLKNWRSTPYVEQFFQYMEYVNALIPSGRDWVTFDLSIVRGLAYYTGIVFELFDRRGQSRAICGGGRYDDLFAAFGRPDLPALGFGMGDVVLTDVLSERGLLGSGRTYLDWWIVREDGASLAGVMRAASGLRGLHQSVEYALGSQSADKQRKAAKTAGATHILTVGTDFESAGQVHLRLSDPAANERAGFPTGGLTIDFGELLQFIEQHWDVREATVIDV